MKSNTDIFGRNNSTYKNDTQDFYFEGLKDIDINNYDYPENMLNLIKEKFPYLIK